MAYDKVELERQLRIAKKKLNDYKDKRRKAKNTIKDAEEVLNQLNSSKKKVEKNLDEILNRIIKKANRLRQHSKLRDDYIREAKKIIKGQKSSQALDKINKSIRNTKNKILNTEDDIVYFDGKISYYERKIIELKSQLNKVDKGEN